MTRARLAGALLLAFALQAALPGAADARTPREAWDNLCEECHGEVGEFAAKYLWQIDGILQGRHHVEDLHLFIDKHYIPDHEIAGMSTLLASLANTTARYVEHCEGCHGGVRAFVDGSIWVRKESMLALDAGIEVGEFLASHRELTPADIDYYLRLFRRMAR